MLDILFRRAARRIRDALPGHTTASRLLRQSAQWRHLPPQQRGAGYVQFHRTQQQLQQIHIEQKLVPKIIDLLFKAMCSHLGMQIAVIAAICALFLIFVGS
jgi:hypothetical protein